MVRTYQRKSTYCKYKKEHILEAVKAIKVDSKPLTKVADEYGIKVSSLYYHLNRYKFHDFEKEKEVKELKNFNQVFTKELEYEFVEQFINATDYCIGLGPMNIRKFAYEFALQNELDLRQTWVEKESAGEDWFNAFLKRHPTITTISTFNANSIQTFFKNYQELMDRYGFEDSRIFKVDEIAFTTAEQPTRVFARRGRKEETELRNLSPDELTTMISTMSASGSALTPMFIIPRTSFVSDMMEKALEGSLKVSNKSGWMTKNDFKEYLAHFVRVAQCDKADPCLMILDNHASCLSLEAIAYAKENGVFIQILPLHTYNQLQPMKDKMFVELRIKVGIACKKWVDTNAGKPMRIRDIIKIVEKVIPKVFTSTDIKHGFKWSNIYPINYGSCDDENMVALQGPTTSDDYEYLTCDVKPLIIKADPDVKEEPEASNEVAVTHVPKDSTKVALPQIEMILGISSPLEKKDNHITSTEQKENIDDNEGEQKSDIKQPNHDEVTIIKNVRSSSRRSKLDKPDKSESGKRRRRKLNSKLSDYICY